MGARSLESQTTCPNWRSANHVLDQELLSSRHSSTATRKLNCVEEVLTKLYCSWLASSSLRIRVLAASAPPSLARIRKYALTHEKRTKINHREPTSKTPLAGPTNSLSFLTHILVEATSTAVPRHHTCVTFKKPQHQSEIGKQIWTRPALTYF